MQNAHRGRVKGVKKDLRPARRGVIEQRQIGFCHREILKRKIQYTVLIREWTLGCLSCLGCWAAVFVLHYFILLSDSMDDKETILSPIAAIVDVLICCEVDQDVPGSNQTVQSLNNFTKFTPTVKVRCKKSI